MAPTQHTGMSRAPKPGQRGSIPGHQPLHPQENASLEGQGLSPCAKDEMRRDGREAKIQSSAKAVCVLALFKVSTSGLNQRKCTNIQCVHSTQCLVKQNVPFLFKGRETTI